MRRRRCDVGDNVGNHGASDRKCDCGAICSSKDGTKRCRGNANLLGERCLLLGRKAAEPNRSSPPSCVSIDHPRWRSPEQIPQKLVVEPCACSLHNGAWGFSHFIDRGMHMTKQMLDEQMAPARYALIAPIVSRQTPLAHGELRHWLRETAGRSYDLPGGRRMAVSERTLERYLAAYRKGGRDALKPQARPAKGTTKLDAALLQQAMDLRRERPSRSVEQLIFLLEESGAAPPDRLAASTLARQLRKASMSRAQVMEKAASGTFRRFEAGDILELLQV